MGLRNKAGPFDWLDTNSINCLEYFYELIQTEFKDFMNNLIISEKYSKPYSQYYPYSCFFHDIDIIDNNVIKDKYSRRIMRFLDHYNNLNCIYVGNLKSNAIISSEIASKLYLDCIKIIKDDKFIKNNHILFIYIRYDEDLNENEKYINIFYTKLKELNNKNIVIMKYNRHLQRDGIWGNSELYKTHFSHLLKLHN